ncbi:hypothetical protein MP638_007400, partial [Amoeboaphelidium occidentale]
SVLNTTTATATTTHKKTIINPFMSSSFNDYNYNYNVDNNMLKSSAIGQYKVVEPPMDYFPSGGKTIMLPKDNYNNNISYKLQQQQQQQPPPPPPPPAQRINIPRFIEPLPKLQWNEEEYKQVKFDLNSTTTEESSRYNSNSNSNHADLQKLSRNWIRVPRPTETKTTITKETNFGNGNNHYNGRILQRNNYNNYSN